MACHEVMLHAAEHLRPMHMILGESLPADELAGLACAPSKIESTKNVPAKRMPKH